MLITCGEAHCRCFAAPHSAVCGSSKEVLPDLLLFQYASSTGRGHPQYEHELLRLLINIIAENKWNDYNITFDAVRNGPKIFGEFD